MADNRLRIVVLGYIVRGPLGGLAWHHLQYLLGLKALGHEVLFVEDSDDYPSCYDPSRQVIDCDPSYGLTFTKNTLERVGLADSWAYFDAHTESWHGPAAPRVVDFSTRADLLLNVSGVNPIRGWLGGIPNRALLDTDPVFTQIKHIQDARAHDRAVQHNRFFTFGENFGQHGCNIPDDGFFWQATRQPVYLAAWPVTDGRPDGHFTTVMQWDSYAPQCFGGRQYGMKSQSFQPFMKLPRATSQRLELALGSESAPRGQLKVNGWILRDPLEVTRDPWSYQQYIRNSKAEFSIAKHGYVVTNSGWFSERSATYLASGRPVVVQDTSLGTLFPVGKGLLTFSDIDEAKACLKEVSSDYRHHCVAARELVQTHFDSRKVLSQLVEQAMTDGSRK